LSKPHLKLAFGQRWVFYGRSGTGKTYTAIQILSLFRRMKPRPQVILISPNATTDKTWKKASRSWRGKTGSKLVDKHYTGLTPKVKDYLNRIMHRRNKPGERKKPLVLMVDDMGEDHTINRTYIDNPIRELAIRSRHLGITLMMLYQSVSETLKVLSTNADVIVAKELGGVQRELLRKMYLEDVSKEEFRTLANECWREPWDTMVIDRTKPPKIYTWRNFDERIQIEEDIDDLTHFCFQGSAKQIQPL
jgi:ABC-type dipeptide/oligopeptide/nickel transport system ATPase component